MDADDSSEINTSSGDIKVEAEVGNLNLIAGNAGESSIKLNTSNDAGGIDMDCGTGGFTIDSKGIFKMDADDSSEINTSSGDKVEAEVGNLNL